MRYSCLLSAVFLMAPMWFALSVSAQTGGDTDQQKLEKEKVDIEKTRVEGDLRLRDEELKLKREELQLRREVERGSGFFSFSAVSGTIAVALIGLLGTAIAGLIQARSNYRTQTDLEKMKFESDLIIKAVETGDLATSTRNLLFLLNAGFISDPKGTIAALASDTDAVPVLPPRAFTSGAFEGIPPEGVGGDPDLNVLRNRDLPPKHYVPMTLEQIVAQPTPTRSETKNLLRRNWPEELLKEVSQIENQGVTVEGFLKRVFATPPLAAYGGRYGDWRLSLVSKPDDELSDAMLAVITPRIRATHPEWTLAKLREWSQASQRVRVSGWLLLRNRVASGGATRWRIHPVLSIEPLDDPR